MKAIRQNPHLSTTDLAELAGERRGKRHPATKMFLALRMVVNSELTEIEKGIPILIEKLRPSKRLVVITYHSTEDRLIKTIFRNCLDKVKLVYKKPLLPSATEIRLNPKARSAKLRCVERI